MVRLKKAELAGWGFDCSQRLVCPEKLDFAREVLKLAQRPERVERDDEERG